MDLREMDGLSRSDLIERAEALGVDRANLLTRAELTDEIVRRTVSDPIERRIARGLLGVARDLVARVVERGLHLPDAAARIRGSERPSWVPPKPPIATVTLAEIYAKQGHRNRALSVLDEVLETEADHLAARSLRDEIAASLDVPPPPVFEEQSAPGDGANGSIEPALAPADAGSGADLLGETHEIEQEPPIGSVGMLEDAPLPESYDVDEIVMMAVDPKTVFVYWEVRQRTADEAQRKAAEGRLVIRLVAVTASWEGPVVETRDLDVRELSGQWFVRDLPVGAVLRAAIGFRAPAGFEPISVAMDVTAPPAAPILIGAGELSRFTSEGTVPIDIPGEAAEVAAAAERARRRMLGRAASEGGGASSWPAMAMSPSSGS